MSFTEEERGLMNRGFSIHNAEHIKLLNSKLAQFENNLKILRTQGYKIGLAAVGAFLTRVIGLTSVLYPTDWACVAYAVHVIHQSGVINQQYRDNFADVRALYDWCFPTGVDLSDKGAWAADPSIQRLVEQAGPLLDAKRISRLEPWMNGSEESSSLGQSLVSGATAVVGKTASWAYYSVFGASQAAQKEVVPVMKPEVFAYMIRQLVQGKSTFSFEYYCYGEGSNIFGDMYNKASQLCEKVSSVSSHLKLS